MVEGVAPVAPVVEPFFLEQTAPRPQSPSLAGSQINWCPVSPFRNVCANSAMETQPHSEGNCDSQQRRTTATKTQPSLSDTLHARRKAMNSHFNPSEADIARRTMKSQRGNVALSPCGGSTRSGGKIECCSHVVTKADNELCFVGEVISMADRRDVGKRELRKSKLQARGSAKERLVRKLNFAEEKKGKPDVAKHSDVASALRELDIATEMEWMRSVDIAGIAFLFHIEAIQEGKFVCGGIANACFTQDRILLSGSKQRLDSCNAFATPCGEESHSERIWNGPAACNESSSKALSSRGKWKNSRASKS